MLSYKCLPAYVLFHFHFLYPTEKGIILATKLSPMVLLPILLLLQIQQHCINFFSFKINKKPRTFIHQFFFSNKKQGKNNLSGKSSLPSFYQNPQLTSSKECRNITLLVYSCYSTMNQYGVIGRNERKEKLARTITQNPP